MVMVPTGQRMAQSPQRIQRVSSFTMADPVPMPRATAAQNAHAPIFRSALENRVHPAVQAALGFLHRGRSVVADLDFGHSGTALERQHWYRRTGKIEKFQGDAVGL